MSDDLNHDAEFAGKHKDEEDPIFVAQRYLNIYRQIHIFNQVRQKEFDDSLLDLPSDVRILLSTLPGGSVLVDHITELEEQRGIISLNNLDVEKTSKSEKKSKKELRAEKNEKQKQKNEDSSNHINISNNILKILQQNEEKHEKDMQALTSAFLQSQENMANILKSVLVETRTQPVIQQQASVQETYENNYSAPQETSFETPQSIETSQPEEISKPKLFGFTRKLFSSHKMHQDSNINKRQHTFINQEQNPLVIDNTPVSLDDITDAPIALDANTDSSPVPSSQTIERTVEEPTQDPYIAEDVGDNDSEWDWEYVEDDDDSSAENADDSEWEYVEEPIDETASSENTENQNNNDDGGEWEYVEEPVDETASSESAENQNNNDEWEYVEEPVVQNEEKSDFTEDLNEQEAPITSDDSLQPEASTFTEQTFEDDALNEDFAYNGSTDDTQETDGSQEQYVFETNDTPEETSQTEYEEPLSDDDFAADQSFDDQPQTYTFETADTQTDESYQPLDDAQYSDDTQEQTVQNNEMDQLFDQFLAANAENEDQFAADGEIITEEHDILNDLTDDESSTSLDDMLQITDENEDDTNKN